MTHVTRNFSIHVGLESNLHMIQVTSGSVLEPFGIGTANLGSVAPESVPSSVFEYAEGPGITVLDSEGLIEQYYNVVELPGEYTKLNIQARDIDEAKRKITRG